MSRFLPIVGLGICVGFAVFFGALLLVVPGLILFTMWYVALPACVLEGIGPFDAMSRSAFLTKGSRWKVFGIALVIFIVTSIAGAVLQGVLWYTVGWIGIIVGSYVVQVVFGAFRGVVVAVLYHDLRVAKEGMDVERIVAVFE